MCYIYVTIPKKNVDLVGYNIAYYIDKNLNNIIICFDVFRSATKEVLCVTMDKVITDVIFCANFYYCTLGC